MLKVRMVKHNISCILLSNVDDLHFVYPCIEQIKDIFTQVIIVMGEQRWNGENEDIEKINELETHIQNISTSFSLIRYRVPDDKIKSMANSVAPAMYWEAHARWLGMSNLTPDTDYVLFLDADEIIDGPIFKKWLDTFEYRTLSGMKLANYWYWREPIYRARKYLEDSVVIVNMKECNPMTIFSNMGRHGIFESCKGTKKRDITFIDEYNESIPFIHHYSWVRTKDQMLRKVQSWGHKDDKVPWVDLVEKEFEKEEITTDFLKGLEYEKVHDIFNISAIIQ